MCEKILKSGHSLGGWPSECPSNLRVLALLMQEPHCVAEALRHRLGWLGGEVLFAHVVGDRDPGPALRQLADGESPVEVRNLREEVAGEVEALDRETQCCRFGNARPFGRPAEGIDVRRRIRPPLARVVRLDPPGHGRAEGPPAVGDQRHEVMVRHPVEELAVAGDLDGMYGPVDTSLQGVDRLGEGKSEDNCFDPGTHPLEELQDSAEGGASEGAVLDDRDRPSIGAPADRLDLGYEVLMPRARSEADDLAIVADDPVDL